MLLAAAVTYSIAHGLLVIAGSIMVSINNSSAIRSGDADSRCFKLFLRWLMFSLPTWTIGANAAVWVSYAFGSVVGYVIGSTPFAVAVLCVLLWQCSTQSPNREIVFSAPRHVVHCE